MKVTDIVPIQNLDLKIYGYALPQLATHQGCVKVGETSMNDVQQRIIQQTGTVGVRPQLLFERNAIRMDGQLFHDKDLHKYYQQRGVERAVLNNRASEWFKFGDLSLAEDMADDYIKQDYDAVQLSDGNMDYILRAEQQNAVESTLAYLKNPRHGSEFLWNAKPRFGKTLTTYDFARKIKAQNVLIVTNRPAIANSWFDDFVTFISWQEPGIKFVSETEALSGRQAMTREQYKDYVQANIGRDVDIRCIAFISLQDLKGAKFAGGSYEKLRWVGDLDWDLLVVDEAHEGIDTLKTDRAFDRINRKFTLHLSGTPFKAIANQKFHTEQIYNWSYLDEQTAKKEWDESELGTNPYAGLPTLNLFTYQLSKMIEQKVSKGIDLDDEANLDYAFDLNEFFSTKEDGSFVYEQDVIRFLDNLCVGKFPFAETEYKKELNHTFWLLPRVASAKALEKLLNRHPFFKDFEIVLAAGDGISLEDIQDFEDLETEAIDGKSNKRSYDKVKAAISTHEKTITLSVSQLTTGVTIKEWTAVFMLSNIKSPALYFQAAFRAQNPYEFQDEATKQWYRKENAYIFDFAPDRTLVLFDEFANNLSDAGAQGTLETRQKNIKELINFFPVIAEDDEGSMHAISAEEVLTIPSHIKATEVVKRGFMSNLLFANIGAIFSAPLELKEILDKIPPEKNTRLGEKRKIEVTNPMLNDQGEVEIDPTITISTTNGLFGQPIFKTDVAETLEKLSDITNRQKLAEKVAENLVTKLQDGFTNTGEQFGLAKANVNREIKAVEKTLTSKIEENLYRREEKEHLAKTNLEIELQSLPSPEAQEERRTQYEVERELIKEDFYTEVARSVEQVKQGLVESHLERQEQVKKKTTEDDVRDHLRGFTRTIPAFLMAYGSPETTLASFDVNIDPTTFEELTSITLDEFRKLRDGFEYQDDSGQIKTFQGLFNEVVFNAAVAEFFKLKVKLADYLHTENDEDIFDYIPPQRTNQIFTPKRVVRMMVDLLEEEDPDIFRHKEATFIDLYTKSGLYLTEIVKRLFIGLEDVISDDNERVKWILENQVYGCAPSNIIYNMVKNYVYAGFPEANARNLLELDLIDAAKQGKIDSVLAERYGKEMKFDIVIGNPPYQVETKDTSDNPIYHLFMQQAYQLADKVCFITPARFLFNAGKTPKLWNQEILKDSHLSVVYYEPDSSKVFPGNIEIKGGVAITYRDERKNFGEIKAFLPFQELKSILEKVEEKSDASFKQLVYAPESYKLSKKLHIDYPNTEELLSKGHKYDVTTNIFEKLSSVFFDNKPSDGEAYIQIYGRENNSRICKWIKRVYIADHENLDAYKVILPKSSGSGKFGEELSTPMIGMPGTAHNQTFISIGRFKTEFEANSTLKYVKTKFVRALLGTLKVTQDNKRATWSNVPMQDFAPGSDIDWTKSVSGIDQQLYKKYGLTNEEISFIETKIRPME